MGKEPQEKALDLRIQAISSSGQSPDKIQEQLNNNPRVDLGGLAYGMNDIHPLEMLSGHAISFAVHVH